MESQLDMAIQEQNIIADQREIKRCEKCEWKHLKESGADNNNWCYMFKELFSGCQKFEPIK